nr:hypothetical protein [Candidatus Sigynarchaeota archaeon]
MQSNLIFFITGQNLNTTRRTLEITDEPSFALREQASLIEAYFPGFKANLRYALFRVVETSVPAFDESFTSFLQRSISIHYAGTPDYRFTSTKGSIAGAMQEFNDNLATSVEFTSVARELRNAGASFAVDNVIHAIPLPPNADDAMKEAIAPVVMNRAGLRVDLQHPEIMIRVIITRSREDQDCLIFIVSFKGTRYYTRNFDDRIAKHRPVFEIGTMNPPLTSLMVNSCHPARHGLLVDPFCGSGGILIEALVRGIPSIGLDIIYGSVTGCMKNLKHFSKGAPAGYHVIHSSIFQRPFRDSFEAENKDNVTITDPPYGRLESLRQLSLEDYIDALLDFSLAQEKICFAIPEKDAVTIRTHVQARLKGATIDVQQKVENPDFARAILLVKKT